jgi:5-methyltetrahydrofolate--homocysteine methyltransferase
VNSTFFALALERGLSAAIMNPYSTEMMKTYYAFRALHGLDENCADYISFASSMPVPEAATPAPAAKASCENGKTELQNAIIKGLREKAATLTKQLLETNEPLDIVQREIIPSLDIIGKGFEEKTVYLPGLLISAEAAKYAFEEIKSFVTEKGGESVKKCDFVLATVRGDVHDIGKNIVKLLLENYGFNVIDLGKDVPPEAVAEAAERTDAPFVGLSALMTTTVPAMEETIKLLRVRAPYAKIIVGGAVLTQEYADRIGADKYAADAMETVRYADSVWENA